MNICRFEAEESRIKIGLIERNSTIIDLSPAGINDLESVLESETFLAEAKNLLLISGSQVRVLVRPPNTSMTYQLTADAIPTGGQRLFRQTIRSGAVVTKSPSRTLRPPRNWAR